MTELTDIDFEDGELVAAAVLPGDRQVAVLFALDDDEAPIEQAAMQSISEQAIDRLTAADLARIEVEVARELIDAVEEDGDRDVEEADAEVADSGALADELELQGVIVSSDATVVLVYEAPDQYPGLVVYAQLDAELLIEELTIAEAEDDDADDEDE